MEFKSPANQKKLSDGSQTLSLLLWRNIKLSRLHGEIFVLKIAAALRVSFDDWMWLLSDDRLFNRAYMKRFGVNIGDVSISFEK